MKTTLFVAAGLVLAALAILPSGQAMQLPPPCQTMSATCCGIDPSFAPCYTLCQPPIATTSAAVILPIPSVGYHVNRDCSVSVTDTWTCPPGFENAPLHLSAGPAHVDGVSCVPICRCMPIESPSAMPVAPLVSSPAATYPCQYCAPHCPAVSVDTGSLVEWYGPGAFASVSSSCQVGAGEGGTVCPSSTERHQTTVHEGPVTASAGTCLPGLDCTCDPMVIFE